MSLYAYEHSARIAAVEPFDALIMAAMRRADTENFRKLKAAFPELADELERRYRAPGGALARATL